MSRILAVSCMSRTNDRGTILICPVCGLDYNHLGTPDKLAGNDCGATGYPVRGDVVRVPLTCEAGHEWLLMFGLHKGIVYLGVQVPKDRP